MTGWMMLLADLTVVASALTLIVLGTAKAMLEEYDTPMTWDEE